MAGVGETGYWRTGVWVEPLDVDGSFRIAATANIVADDKVAERGGFVLAGAGDIVGTGNTFQEGFWRVSGTAATEGTGGFVKKYQKDSFVRQV